MHEDMMPTKSYMYSITVQVHTHARTTVRGSLRSEADREGRSALTITSVEDEGGVASGGEREDDDDEEEDLLILVAAAFHGRAAGQRSHI
jgi:hypothetical protein